MFKKLLCLLTFALLASTFVFSQVTTSSITGFVKGDKNEPLVGATVTLTYNPTGNVYRTITKTGGKFDFNNLNPGGPYTIEVSFVSFQNYKQQDIFLTLGES